MNLVTRFAADESGATAIEYGLIAGLIAVGIIVAATTQGTSQSSMIARISGKQNTATIRRNTGVLRGSWGRKTPPFSCPGGEFSCPPEAYRTFREAGLQPARVPPRSAATMGPWPRLP